MLQPLPQEPGIKDGCGFSSTEMKVLAPLHVSTIKLPPHFGKGNSSESLSLVKWAWI